MVIVIRMLSINFGRFQAGASSTPSLKTILAN